MHTDFYEKSEGKRPHARPWRRLEDDIKIDLKDKIYDAVDSIKLAQDRVQW
jgi:hypothetical protein